METTRMIFTPTTPIITIVSTPPIPIIQTKEYLRHNNERKSQYHSENDDSDNDDLDNDYDFDDYDSNTEYHDDEECDSSGHCEICCKLSKCTTKDEWVRQGQYECDKGMYFPCTICEPHFNGKPQYIDKSRLDKYK